MVQIIERPPSFGEQLGRSLGGGFGKGFSSGIGTAVERKSKQKLVEQIRSGQKNRSQEFADQMKGEGKASKQSSSDYQQEAENHYQNAEQFLAAGLKDEASVELKRAENAEKQGLQKEKLGHTTTQKYADDLRTASGNADEVKFATKMMREAMRSGKTGATAQNLAYSYLSSEGVKSPFAGIFQSKEAGKFTAGIKTLASGFKKIMGSKPTEREFFWYENILPGLLKKGETNEAILDYFDHLADVDIKAQEIADQITTENGGVRPGDLDIQVRKQMKPFFNEVVNEGFALSGEFDSGEKSAADKRIFTDMPPANKANKGKILTDEDSGEQFLSNGTEWIPVNG